MAQEESTPEEVWQPVVCRLCAHRFAVLVRTPEDALVALCHPCSILVDWFGQVEEARPETAAPPPDHPNPPHKERAANQPLHQQSPLAGLLDNWGELWRSEQE